MSDFSKLVEVAPSVVVAVLFAIFAWRLIQDQRMFAREMMADWGDRMKQRDELWRETINENQKAYSAGMARLAEELKDNTTQIAVVQSQLFEHDRGLQELMPALRAALYTTGPKE